MRLKKIFLLLFTMQLIFFVSNAQVKVTQTIITNDTADLYPTHIDSLGKGGYMVVSTIAMRNRIPMKRRKQGMLVFVQSVDTLYKLNSSSLNDLSWLPIGLSSVGDVDKYLKYTKINDSTYDTLHVKANTIIDSNLEVKGRLILNTALEFQDSLVIQKGARIKKGLIVGDSLFATKTVLISSTLKIDSLSSHTDSLQYAKNKFIDSANKVKLVVGGGVRVDSSVYIRGNFRLGGDLILDSGLFRQNFIVNLGEGVRFGRYSYKDTILAKGKSIDEVFYEILTDITHPLYVQPSMKILYLPTIDSSTKNKILRYEIGFPIGDLHLSSSFTQNNAGVRLTTTYRRNSSIFSDSTDRVSILTDTLYYTSSIFYDSGAILKNRIGNLDTIGRVTRGTINSDTISIFPFSKTYWGNSLYSDTINITDSLLLGLDTSRGFGYSDTAYSAAKTNFNIPVYGGEKYIYYAYPAIYPDLTSIMVGPFESLDAFTKYEKNVVNAQGYRVSYKIYISINNFSDKVEKIVIN